METGQAVLDFPAWKVVFWIGAAVIAWAVWKRIRHRRGGDRPLTNPINFVTGTLGSGKSYFAMKVIRDYVRAGKIVACNFDLHGDWWASWQPRPRGSRLPIIGKYFKTDDDGVYSRAWAAEARQRVYRVDAQDDLYNYRLPGEGEDRGLLVLDESGLTMNAREYGERGKRDRAKYGSGMKSLEFYINMRKRGWTCIVLAHHQDQLDNQLRQMGGTIVRLRNLARVMIPFIGVPMAKNDRFVAVHIWPETKPPLVMKKEVFGLDLTVARHYKSMDEFAAIPDTGKGMRLQSPGTGSGRVARQPSQPVYSWDNTPRTRRRSSATPAGAARFAQGSNGEGASAGPLAKP